jgi:hypothetical protein
VLFLNYHSRSSVLPTPFSPTPKNAFRQHLNFRARTYQNMQSIAAFLRRLLRLLVLEADLVVHILPRVGVILLNLLIWTSHRPSTIGFPSFRSRIRTISMYVTLCPGCSRSFSGMSPARYSAQDTISFSHVLRKFGLTIAIQRRAS